MQILGIIPARGGSKGIPGKNIKLLAGKPLIQYSIETALDTPSLSKVMVSTDSQEIAEISSALGAEVPELRPTHLATDSSPTIDTVGYTLAYYAEKGINYDAVCLLQPTSPMRTSKDVTEAIEIFKKRQFDSLISVLPVPHEYNPHWVFTKDNNGGLRISTGEKKIISRRQDLPSAYHRNGSIYLTQASVIVNQNSLYGATVGYYEMSMKDHVNIDTHEDWVKAEDLIKSKL